MKYIKTKIDDFLSEKTKWSAKIQKEFDEWKKDNVSKKDDGTYSTQDAQYRNKLKDLAELKQYYAKEFLS